MCGRLLPFCVEQKKGLMIDDAKNINGYNSSSVKRANRKQCDKCKMQQASLYG
jgi:hypothetical protein